MLARVILLAGVFSLLCNCAVAGPAVDGIHVVGPYTSGNLSVYLVRGPNLMGDQKYLSLAEALKKNLAVVHEKQHVNELSVENLSDQDLYLQAGEIVKGGRQDRTLGRDMVVSAHSGEIPIAAHCVEHGRWTQRGGENDAQFSSSENSVASKAVKAANFDQSQSGVWENVHGAQAKLAANAPSVASSDSVQAQSPSSFELTIEDKGVTTAAELYKKDIEKSVWGNKDLVGFFFAINGKLNSGDIYASTDLFSKMYPKLLHAAAVEALGDREAVSVNKIYDVPAPDMVQKMIQAVDSADAKIQPLSAAGMEDAINAQAHVRTTATSIDRTVIRKRQSDDLVMYESQDIAVNAPFLHRAYLTK